MRAFSQFRCTVRSDTSRMAAISPNENPQKKLQIDHLRERRLYLAQFFQHLADARQLSVIYRILSSVRVERG